MSDAHLVEQVTDCQRRVLAWAARESLASACDEVILGGDLTHHASVEQARGFLGNLQVHVSGGLDPVKVRGHHPELFIGHWDGQTLGLQTRRTSPQILRAVGGMGHPLGLAYRTQPQELLETALQHDVRAIQFRCSDVRQAADEDLLGCVSAFRERCQPGFLSLHLPDMPADVQGYTLDAMARLLSWAEAIGVDDMTIHLPTVPARQLLDKDSLVDSPWVRQCMAIYEQLAERALHMGAQLSLENVYHHAWVAPEEELLGTRPRHLIAMVQALASRLRARGWDDKAVSRIGVIFDTGHAFRDPVVSKEHGLGDWIIRLAPWLQLAHIHQTVAINGRLVNHRAIDNPLGPRMNYAGILPMLCEHAQRSVPLLLEVRDRDEALVSLASLRQIMDDRVSDETRHGA